MPAIDAIDTEGLDVSKEDMADLLHINKEEWLAEVASIRDGYKLYGDKLPAALAKQLEDLEQRLQAL
jgi:phosphoenolpyruvate carboxykinase (GTP)